MDKKQIDSEHYDFSEIPGSSSWFRISEITDGNSSDRKFCINAETQQQYFLKLADLKDYDRKKLEYEHLKKVKLTGALVPEPVCFGASPRGKYVYMLTRWIHGEAGKHKLLKLTPAMQYENGIAAGEYLLKAHYCSIQKRPAHLWESAQLKRWRLTSDAYRRSNCKILYQHKLFNMIKNSLPLMANRPQCLLHGDFSTDNFILSCEDSLNLIDFGNWCYGDPLFDLANVMTKIRRTSLPFAIGVLDCYFSMNFKEKDFKLINLYAAVDLVESVTSVEKTSPEALDGAMENCQIFMRDLHGCRNVFPIWFTMVRATCKKVNQVDAGKVESEPT